MFNFIRKHRNFFSIIFVLAAAGMIISLFGSGGAGTTGGAGFFNAGNAGKVLSERITINEFAQAFDYRWKEAQQTLKSQFQGQDSDPQTKAFIEQLLRAQVSPQSVLNGLIQQKFIMAVAKEQGFVVPPVAVKYLLSKNPIFQKDGKFDAILYKQYVARPGDYEDSLKKELLRESIFYNFSIPLANVSKGELEEAMRLRESFVFETLEVDPSKITAQKSVSKAEIDALANDIAREQEIKGYFEIVRAQYESAAQVKAKHILIRKESGGRAKADEVRAEIASGKISFEDAAKKYSDDKSNALRGGDLGFFEHKVMDPKFADAAFALKKEEPLSGVVESSFGFHLIKFEDRKEEVKKNFSDVKEEIARKYLESQAAKDFVLAELKGVAQEGKSLSQAQLKALGTEWKAQQAWTPMDESLGGLSANSLDMGELFKLSKSGELYPRVVPQGEKFYVLRMKSRKKAELDANSLRAEKGAVVLQGYLDRRLKDLEDQKKIYRNESLMAQFQDQLKTF